MSKLGRVKFKVCVRDKKAGSQGWGWVLENLISQQKSQGMICKKQTEVIMERQMKIAFRRISVKNSMQSGWAQENLDLLRILQLFKHDVV